MTSLKTRLLSYFRLIKGSYWLVPGLFVVGSLILGALSLSLDELLSVGPFANMEQSQWFGPDGARAILTTVGGSMISVAGIIFSITIAAIVFASGQYGPHVIPTFMRDRSNQATLGVFIATFIYCLGALFRVHGGEEAYVPYVTIVVALGFAGASLIMFIHFIHHILETLHVSNIVDRLGHDYVAKVEQRFPSEIGAKAGFLDSRELPESFLVDAVPVRADGAGYIHTLSGDAVFAAAEQHHLIVRLTRRPGDFVAPGRPLAWIWPPEQATAEVRETIRRCYAWGAQKTVEQDIGFLIDQLTGITARALSPGINDPDTAIDTIHWLGAGISLAGKAPTPQSVRRGDDGKIRVIAMPTTFENLAEHSFGRIRPYVAPDRNAALTMVSIIADALFDIDNEDHRACLLNHAHALHHACKGAMTNDRDVEEVGHRVRDIEAVIRNGLSRFRAGEKYRWLEGSG